MALVFLRHSLSGVCNADRASAAGMSQRHGDGALCRSVFQGVGHEVEEHMSYLLTVGNHDAAVLACLHTYADALSLCHGTEILCPCLQVGGDVEAVEREFRLLVLYLAELQYLTHHLGEDSNVATYHLNEFPHFATDGGTIRQAFGRSGDEGERSAQLM